MLALCLPELRPGVWLVVHATGAICSARMFVLHIQNDLSRILQIQEIYPFHQSCERSSLIRTSYPQLPSHMVML
jgi:hypothetical protein